MRVRWTAALVGALVIVGGGAWAETPVFQKPQEGEASSLTVRVVGDVKTTSDDHGCPNGIDDETSDLCAQWTAAKAARDSTEMSQRAVTAAEISNRISFVSMIGALAAALGAGYSVYYARRSLHADRAWITLDSCELQSEGRNIRCVFVWENTGKSPALNVKIWTAYRVSYATLPILDRSEADLSEVSEPVLAAGKKRDAPPIIFPEDRPAGDLNFSELDHYVYCFVEYEDVFERKKRVSVSCRTLNHNHPCDQKTLAVGPMNYVN